MIYLTSDEIAPRAMEILRSAGDVKVIDTASLQREKLVRQLGDADALFSLVRDRIDSEVIRGAPRLRVIANMAVGYDNIDLQAATERGIYVTNTPGVLTDTTADLAIALMLAVARRIPEAARYVRDGRWVGSWKPTFMLGSDVHGKTLAVIGLGRIGEAVARRANAFGMRVVYCSRHERPDLERELGVQRVTFEHALRECDFLTIHAPLLPETRHMIGKSELSLMKRSAFLINTSRGPLVDEAALIDALRDGKIAGAALDVFEREPISSDNPLLSMDNVVAVPHIGSATIETRTKMAIMAAENIAAALRGEVPPNLVNRQVLSKR